LAYPQAKVDGEIYMRLPKGFEIPGSNKKGAQVLKLLRKIYGLKQAQRA